MRKRPATIAIIFLNTLVYIFVSWRSGNWWLPDSGVMLDLGANFNGLTLAGEWWRLFSCMFLHYGIVHLAVNMLALFSLGSAVEEAFGSVGFLVIYFTCGLSASVSSLLFNDFVMSAGASGAIFGLFGVEFSYLLMGAWKKRQGMLRQLLSASIMLGINLWLGFTFRFIDNAAHLGGFAGGIFIGAVFGTLSRMSERKTSALLFTCILLIGAAGALYATAPKYPAWYYSIFRSYAQNEKEASRVLDDREHGSDDNTFRLQLVEAKRLWDLNKRMIDSFPYAPEQLRPDLEILRKYALLHERFMDLYITSIDRDSYLFLDSLEYVGYDIGRLPELRYKLDFYSHPGEDKNKKASLRPVTFYYDKEWEETSRAGAYYFRLAEVDSLGRVNGRVRDYYADSIVQMKGDYTNDLKDGIFFYYYPDGWYESAGRYSNDAPVGKWQHFYPNRQIRSEERYDLGNHLFWNFWDENGLQLVSEGNGIFIDKYANGKIKEAGRYKNGLQDSTWLGFYEDGKPRYTELWKDGLLLKGKSFTEKGRMVEYTKVYEEPRPETGLEKYMNYIRKNTHYPITTAKVLPEGLLIIELTVDTDGTILKMKPYTKLGAGCEARAMLVIKQGCKFLPARLRGIPIREKTQVPFEFKH